MIIKILENNAPSRLSLPIQLLQNSRRDKGLMRADMKLIGEFTEEKPSKKTSARPQILLVEDGFDKY